MGKPYECTECRRSFEHQSTLNRHKLSHSGVKPYKCTEPGCGKSFALKGHLKSHMVVHTRQKPYECAACGRSFGRKDTLNRHKLSHSGEKLQDEVDIVEQELVHEEVPVGEELVHEEVLVKCEEVVMEEMECKAQCEEMEGESDPLS